MTTFRSTLAVAMRRPSGLNARSSTWSVGVVGRLGRPVLGSQTVRVLAAVPGGQQGEGWVAVASVRPSGLNSTALVNTPLSVRTLWTLRSAVPHSVVWPELAVATVRPSGLNAT